MPNTNFTRDNKRRAIITRLRFLLLSFFLVAVLLTSSNFTERTYAADTETSTEINYVISDNTVKAGFDFTIKNTSGRSLYYNYYTVIIPFSNISEINASQGNKSLEVSFTPKDKYNNVQMQFSGLTIPNNGTAKIRLSVTTNDFQNSFNSTVKQFTLPANYATDLTVSKVSVKYDKTLGEIKSSSMEPDSQMNASTNNEGIYRELVFTKPQALNIQLIIAHTVSYDFMINKLIENPDSDTNIFYELYLPKSQYNQSLTFQKIEPKPNSAYLDNENNIVFLYEIEKSSSIQVDIAGTVNIDREQAITNITSYDYSQNTRKIDYWQINKDSEIRKYELYANGSKINVDTIYRYILNKYSLDKDIENREFLRMGAETSIEQSKLTVEDFCDVLIAFLRHYNIPARMVSGIVYSETPYFHSWVEYYNSEKGWLQLDPAYDKSMNTVRVGQLLTDHVAIITRSSNALAPYLDYSVAELKLSSLRESTDPYLDFSYELSNNQTDILQGKTQAIFVIKNSGNTIIKSYEFNIENFTTNPNLNSSELLLPEMSTDIPFKVELTTHLADPLYLLNGEIVLTDTNDSTKSMIIDKSISITHQFIPLLLAYLLPITIIFTLASIILIIVEKYGARKKKRVS